MSRSWFLIIILLILPVKIWSQVVVDFSATPTTVCGGSTVIFTDLSTGVTAGSAYGWNFGAGASPISSNSPGPITVTYTGSGQSTVSLTIVDPVNGTFNTSKTNYITVNVQPVVTLAAAGPLCSNSPDVQLAGTPSGGIYTGTGVSSTGLFSPVTSGQGIFNIIYTFTDINSCTNSANINITVDPVSSAPVTGVIQPTCTVATGTITVTVQNAGETYSFDNGSTFQAGNIKSGLAAGTYDVVIKSTGGCNSVATATVVNTQPSTPVTPVTSVTQPTCSVATGTITVTVQNAGETYSFDNGTTFQASNIKSGLVAGTYNIIMKSTGGCNSSARATVVNVQPVVPAAPIIGTLTQPACNLATGSVVLTGLPASGIWTITRSPGGVITTGSGTGTTISGLGAGTYTFTVTNSVGCTSIPTSGVVINAQPSSPSVPVQTIDCSLGFGQATVTVTSPVGTGLVYSMDGGTFTSATTFTGVSNGSHIITVKNAAGCSTIGNSFSVSCGCVNGPSLSLSSTSGSTCGITPMTLSGNTFGGNATSVSIASNGAGTINPITISASPFTFTYTPAASDAGKTVVITLVTNNPLGAPCAAASASFSLTVNAVPAAPVTGAIIQPTCSISTGSVTSSGLPSTGTWTIMRTPGSVSTSGTGSGITISDLQAGVYTYTVSLSTGCASTPTAGIAINSQPAVPAAPIPGTITQPACTLPTGSVVLAGLPGTGTWTITRYPGTVVFTGNGTNTNIQNLAPGTYNFTVTSSSGCTSTASANIVLISPPSAPTAPVIDSVRQPTCNISTGKVYLSGLPATGTWTITRNPGGTTQSGTGTIATASGLPDGTYTFSVTSSAGCISGVSVSAVIAPDTSVPLLKINNPVPVCFPSTVDLTKASLTAGSASGLTYSYWINSSATIAFNSPLHATAGTYYIKGTVTATGCYDIKQVTISVLQPPVANAGSDQVLENLFNTTLQAKAQGTNETGLWTVRTGSGRFSDATNAGTSVDNLASGKNVFLWTVSNGVCSPSTDSVTITVENLLIPTLITPNNDGKNDYFVIGAKESLGKIELVIFDRTGMRVYKNENYNNDWNGVDEKGNPLPDDTYFFIIKTSTGGTISKYIVVRR